MLRACQGGRWWFDTSNFRAGIHTRENNDIFLQVDLASQDAQQVGADDAGDAHAVGVELHRDIVKISSPVDKVDRVVSQDYPLRPRPLSAWTFPPRRQ